MWIEADEIRRRSRRRGRLRPGRENRERRGEEVGLPGIFENALSNRVEAMLDACTACGKCFEACPITGPAGIAGTEPREAIAGVLDIVRNGGGPEPSAKWANSCVLSGARLKVCDSGVHPRLLPTTARAALAPTT